MATCIIANRKLKMLMFDEHTGARRIDESHAFAFERSVAVMAVFGSFYKAVLFLILYATFYINCYLILMRMILSAPVYLICLVFSWCSRADASSLMVRRFGFLVPRLSTRRGDWLWRVYAFVYKDLIRTVPFEEELIACMVRRAKTQQGSTLSQASAQYAPAPSYVAPMAYSGPAAAQHAQYAYHVHTQQYAYHPNPYANHGYG